MTLNRGQAARRIVSARGQRQAAPSSSATSSSSNPVKKAKMMEQQQQPHQVSSAPSGSSEQGIVRADSSSEVKDTTAMDLDEPRCHQAVASREAKQVEEEESGSEVESGAEDEDGREHEEGEVSGSQSGKEQEEEEEEENEEGDDEDEEEDGTTSGYDSDSSSSSVDSYSTSSSERSNPRDLKGCRADIRRQQQREVFGLDLADDFTERSMLEHCNLTREEIAAIKERAHRFNVRFNEAARGEPGDDWLQDTIERMHGFVLYLEGRVKKGNGRRMTHPERHIVKMARMAMVDCQHVQAKERRREERRRGGG